MGLAGMDWISYRTVYTVFNQSPSPASLLGPAGHQPGILHDNKYFAGHLDYVCTARRLA